MECARADGASRGACAIYIRRKIYQCRFSFGSFDPTCQYYDAGAGRAVGAAPAGFSIGDECAIAFTAPGNDCSFANGGQKAGGVEIGASTETSSTITSRA